MRILATYSIKGGVGKTTAAVNLAHEAAVNGARVLLWDLDPQGATTFVQRVKPSIAGGARRLVGRDGEIAPHLRGTDTPGLDLLPADLTLRNLDRYLDDRKQPTRRLGALLRALDEDYDVAILDCAPGLTLGSESAFAAADALLVPTIPSPLSVRTLHQLVEFVGDAPSPLILPFLSMYDRRRRRHRELAAELEAGPIPFLATAIPNLSVVERMADERAAVQVYAPRTAAAAAFRSLWAEVAARLWG